MPITGLGHTGFWVDDLDTMRDFYARVLGLTVTDEDPDRGIVFFSARPDLEHHEFVLQRGRTAPPGSTPHDTGQTMAYFNMSGLLARRTAVAVPASANRRSYSLNDLTGKR